MVAELSVANESLKESLRDQNEFASIESKNAILEQELAKVKRRRGEGLYPSKHSPEEN
jgi:ribosome-associated translation inhibitor RaiA